MRFDRNGLEVLSRATCLDLLATTTIGRIAVSMDALPAILPVNFGLLGENVVFKVGLHSKLRAAASNAVVAFEADYADWERRQAWSVLVTGMATEISSPQDLALARVLDLGQWSRDKPACYIMINARIVTGRRITPDTRPGLRGTEAQAHMNQAQPMS